MNRLAAFSILAAAVVALANGTSHGVYVLNSPEHVKIKREVPLQVSELPDVILAMFGFTIPQGLITWNKLEVTDPFSFPEAVVVLEIPGLKNPGFDLNKVDHHDLILDIPINHVYPSVEHIMKDRLKKKEYNLLHGSLTNEEFLKSQVFQPKFKLNPSIKPQHLDSYDEKYKVFFDEIFNLHQLVQGVKENVLKNDVLDFHWFQLQGIKALIAVHEPNSQETKDAEQILNEAISSLVQSYNEVFNNQVLFLAIASNNTKPLERNKRELTNDEKSINVAESPYEYYPAIFNLLLWFAVIFIFSLIAISLSIAQMDPGRDSIIYRMTSNRMKKEN